MLSIDINWTYLFSGSLLPLSVKCPKPLVQLMCFQQLSTTRFNHQYPCNIVIHTQFSFDFPKTCFHPKLHNFTHFNLFYGLLNKIQFFFILTLHVTIEILNNRSIPHVISITTTNLSITTTTTTPP